MTLIGQYLFWPFQLYSQIRWFSLPLKIHTFHLHLSQEFLSFSLHFPQGFSLNLFPHLKASLIPTEFLLLDYRKHFPQHLQIPLYDF